jgi:hypothetical protein
MHSQGQFLVVAVGGAISRVKEEMTREDFSKDSSYVGEARSRPSNVQAPRLASRAVRTDVVRRDGTLRGGRRWRTKS